MLSVEMQKHLLKNELVKYCQKLDQKGFGANHDGNITAKCEDVLLATPTAVSKGNINYEMIITLDDQGNKIEGSGKPFSEIKLHLAAYRAREDAKAVVHAHPPFATARGLLNLPIIPALPEAIVSLGDTVPVTAFSMPGTKENEASVIDILNSADVFMMAGNGVFAVGSNIEQAYLRVELVEHLAKIDYYAKAMGMPMELSRINIDSLLEKRAAAGLGPKGRKPATVPASKNTETPAIIDSQLENIKCLIAEEIKKIINR